MDETDKQLRQKLEQVTEEILDLMQYKGWRWGKKRGRTDRPAPIQINNGYCEYWAHEACRLVGGRTLWLDRRFRTMRDWHHNILFLNGKYYDSTHLDGCRTLREFRRTSNQALDEFLETTGDR